MKITGIETIVIENKRIHPGGAKWLFIQLTTDEGLVGLGERPTALSSDIRPQISLFHTLAEQFLIGENPFDIEKLWQRAYGAIHDFRHPSLFYTPALSAMEIACWDIVGKAANQPIYNLLGGKCHDKLRAYAYMPSKGIWENPEKAGEVAARLLEEGNTACKIDPFMPLYPLPRDIPLKDLYHAAQIFRSIRDAVGDRLEIGIGTHGQFTTAGAIRCASVFEEYRPFWFEEPVPPENVDEMARVAAHTSIPIASGERLVTKYEFTELLEKQAAQIIQLDVAQCGGILESKKIAAIADAHYAMIAPHMYVGPVAAAAAVQLDTCSSNFLIQEFNVNPLHSEIFIEPIRFEKGFITPPSGPGLGIELNPEVVKRHRIDA